MNPQRLEQLARVWRQQVTARHALFALGGACFASALAFLWVSPPLLTGAVAFIVIFIGRLAYDQPWHFDALQLSRHLNRTCPEFEESSALWLRDRDEFTTLEKLQLARAESALARMESGGGSAAAFAAPPRTFLHGAWGWCGAGVVVLAVTGAWLHHQRESARIRSAAGVLTTHEATLLNPLAEVAAAMPNIIHAELIITPPTYTGLPERRVSGFNAEVEEGSQVTWSISLDKPISELKLIYGENKDSALLFLAMQNHYEARKIVRETALIHLSGTLPDGTVWNPPELYSLKIRKDLAPAIRLVQPALTRTEILPPPAESGGIPVAVEAFVSDDYAVAETHIVATVAKGTGEAVKFREQSIPFDSDADTSTVNLGESVRSSRRVSKTLDLRALGLEPGDELYFYVEASDNRQPAANHTRSETRFVSLKGPDIQAPTAGRGVAGVNLVPQYFRSQRQVIIDTEKLIADQPNLTNAEFRQRANDLGIDQQLLRLRYGQFLGEELEQGQGAGDHQEIPLNPLQRGIAAGVPSELVHQHDNAPAAASDPRAGPRTALRLKLEHEEQARQGGGDHDGLNAPSAGTPLAPGQIVAPFVDQHDKQDEATFFDHETKSTLRDALAAMWDAEGFLRTARPQEALKPENTALVILKDLQQSARAYVQRVGFEPSPLRETERRLKGDVADVRNRFAATYAASAEDVGITQIRTALKGVVWSEPARLLTPAGRELLHHVEPALTEAATRQPELFLAGLKTLRRALTEHNAAPTQGEITSLEQALLRLLPPAETKPMLSPDSASALTAPYFKALAQPVSTP